MSEVKCIPLYDRVLVRRVDAKAENDGVLVPENSKEKSQEGVVVAVGCGYIDGTENFVKVGQRVLFGKHSGTEIKVAGELFQIMREEEILAILPE
jgi:chaperonin GroES